MSETIKFEKGSIKSHLDSMIRFWRDVRDRAKAEQKFMKGFTASCYIDAYQSMRKSIFNELLPEEEQSKVEVVK